MTYYVTPAWERNIAYIGQEQHRRMHVEAPTLEEFQEVVLDVAPELIVTNHPGAAAEPPETLLPTTTWNYGEPLLQRSG